MNLTELQNYINTFKCHIPWKEIEIHHSLSKDGSTNDWVAIKNWHMGKIGSPDINNPNYNPYVRKPMLDIGYHFGIEKVGDTLVYQVGRSLNMFGGHTVGHNKVGIGICLLGNYDVSIPTDDQYFCVSQVCGLLLNKFYISKDCIYPHSKFANKSCPGTKFDMSKLKSLI